MDLRVLAKMRKELQKEFTRFEIEESLYQMTSLKSPSSNGFGACFYQSYWNLVRDKLKTSVLSVTFFPTKNSTYIALIPKIQKLESVGEF